MAVNFMQFYDKYSKIQFNLGQTVQRDEEYVVQQLFPSL